MKRIEFDGWTALVEAYVKSGSDELQYISIVGPSVVTRAIAAALVATDRRKWDSGIMLAGMQCHLERFANYKVISSQLEERKAHGITTRRQVIGPGFTVAAIGGETFQMLQRESEDGCPSAFMPRLRTNVRMPLKMEWASWLWQEGQEDVRYARKSPNSEPDAEAWFVTSQPIVPMEAYGVKAWLVDTDYLAWAALVRRHLGLSIKARRTTPTEWVGNEWMIRKIGDRFGLFRDGQACERYADSFEGALATLEHAFGVRLEANAP